MKIIKLLLIILCTLAFSCQRYDDSAIWDELRDHKERIARLEALCETMNSNISALENIVEALQANDYVTGVTPISEEGQKVGYTITFSKSGAIDIYHGKDGADGTSGQDGAPGQDGTDGKDGHTPTIGVRKDTDGIYYWTLDGEWLTDNEGNKIPTTGADGTPGQDGEEGKPGLDGENGQDGKPGADGKPGQNGNDGITPLLKIENEFWYISYDNGKTWQQLYKAVGEDGAAGANGTDGAPGKDGNSFFQSVDTTNPNYIILTLADGSQIKIPTWKAFEELQTQVNQMNSNLSALQTILQALEANIYVTEITPIIENSKETGYIIYLSDGQFITIYHGKDGSDGAPGQDGEDGKDGVDGADGKDGYTPNISVKQGEDGKYYWIVDGEWMEGSTGEDNWVIDGGWLTDGQGNKIPATGKDGVTPTLKIVDGYWYISYDNGKTWNTEPLGSATANADGGIFKNITYDDEGLYITLSNGETITLSRHEQNLLELCDISPINITDRGATFIGSLDIPEKDLTYSQVTIYYSNYNEFNIYEAKSVTTTSFDYNQSFTLHLNELRPDTDYYYCLHIRVKDAEIYGDLFSFRTCLYSDMWTDITPVFNFTDPGIISSSNGNFIKYDGWIASDYVDVSNFSSIKIKMAKTSNTRSSTGLAFYDDNKKYISGIAQTDGIATEGIMIKEISIPENVKYIRTTYWSTSSDRYKEAYGAFFCHAILIDKAIGAPVELTIIDKSYIDKNDGTVKSGDAYSGWAITDYIKVQAGRSYCFTACTDTGSGNGNGAALYFYDKDQKPIDCAYGTYNAHKGVTFCIPNEVSYIRIGTLISKCQMTLQLVPEYKTISKRGEWLSVLYTGDSGAHDEFMNYTETIGRLSNVPCAYLDPAIQSLLTGKKITMFACYTLGSNSSCSFYTNPYDGVNNTTSKDKVLLYTLTDDSSTTTAGTKTKTEYPIDIYIEDGHTLAIGDMIEIYSPINNSNINISYKLPIYYASVEGAKYTSKLPYFIAFDFYIEDPE